jgi:hypothetical protein
MVCRIVHSRFAKAMRQWATRVSSRKIELGDGWRRLATAKTVLGGLWRSLAVFGGLMSPATRAAQAGV